MNFMRIVDAVFPYIEPLDATQRADESQRLQNDIAAINATTWIVKEERALDVAQRIADADMERVRTAEGKATTYLAVLSALVPLIITLQAANWENKAGPAPNAVRLFVLVAATAYVSGAGYHAFKTLQVTGFQRVGEGDLAAAWGTSSPLVAVTRSTLLASRRSRAAVNSKVTRIRVTHQHLLRAFMAFILLLLLDPLFYVLGYRNVPQDPAPPCVVVVQRLRPVVPPVVKCNADLAVPVARGDAKLLPKRTCL